MDRDVDRAGAAVGDDRSTGPTGRPEYAPFGVAGSLFWISVLGLYLELLLIRWIGTEIRIFAYLQNTVLVVCFLGLGLGLFTASKPIRFGRAIFALALLAAALSLPLIRPLVTSTSELLSVLGDINIWLSGHAESRAEAAMGVLVGLSLAFFVLVTILEAFVPLGRALGRLLEAHPAPVVAYSINVAGSLLGIWLFVGLSSLSQPPWIWFVVLALLFGPLFYRRAVSGAVAIGLIFIVAAGVWSSYSAGAERVVWSPYQKLALLPVAPESPRDDAERWHIRVNNVGYQQMLDLRPEVLRRAPDVYPPEQVGYSQYDIPLLLHRSPRKVLIVGSGGGNDVAAALRQGADRVTAVEIDPDIVEFGRRHHPERPYASERVDVVVDDARSYFARTRGEFDLIVFGLLDSHTTGALTNTRLDHYVYTLESLERARDLLAPSGLLVLSFDPIRDFVIDRIAVGLRETFGEEPIGFLVPGNELGWGGTLLVAGNTAMARNRIESDRALSALIDAWDRRRPVRLSYATAAATDDWPFLYLEGRRVPPLFYLMAGVMLLLLVYASTERSLEISLGSLRWRRAEWHFFFLGAAFLLLEVHNISDASVALGSTWVVNAVIISGVLLMILLANLVVLRAPRLPIVPVYLALLGSAAFLYFFDVARLAGLSLPLKAALVGSLTTVPMVFSGIVFARSFAVVPRKDLAMGANLLGALAGALLQSVSFVTGMKFLLLLVFVLYTMAILTGLRYGRARRPEAIAATRRGAAPRIAVARSGDVA